MTSEASTSPQKQNPPIRHPPSSSRVLLRSAAVSLPASVPAAPPPSQQTTTEDRANDHDRQEAQVLQEAAQGQPLGANADAAVDTGKRRRSGAAKRHQAEEEEFMPSSICAKILRKALK